MVVVERRRARAGLGGGERKKCELEKKELRWRIKREKKKGGGAEKKVATSASSRFPRTSTHTFALLSRFSRVRLILSARPSP